MVESVSDQKLSASWVIVECFVCIEAQLGNYIKDIAGQTWLAHLLRTSAVAGMQDRSTSD